MAALAIAPPALATRVKNERNGFEDADGNWRGGTNGAVPAHVHVQVEAVTAKTQREGKPSCELALADAWDRMTLRVWNDHPNYKTCSAFTTESFIELTGDFRVHPQYGLEADKWMVRPLSEQEKKELLEGPAACAQSKHLTGNLSCTPLSTIVDPRLAHCPKRSSTNGATDFVVPQRLANIITLGAAASSSTLHR